ncbi:MAG: chloride channel protein [Prevotella sp.]|jgi:CIC family chloride channel protein|nr:MULTISPECIES: chloride channel protein [unclassified Prevotella]MCH3971112.1 chloride channel protein [Prevotella sp.]MCH3991154.1 chloride channel protein [Prevotella sp.]MCH4018318.1 chloride channel protein [Prevotella sp.]MCI1325102.1 chloride channel protein [Prevotella sp.]MCI1549217.1 chloride channel protein [Prevotella sp.]
MVVKQVLQPRSLFENIVDWTQQHLSDRQMMVALSFVVGFLAAVATFILHWIIRQIQLLLTEGFQTGGSNWLYLIFPIVGIALTVLFVKYVVRDNISHGITRVLYALATKRSRLKVHNCWTSVIASSITIGFGGSVGGEAPIVLTGSAIGSNLGQLFKRDNKTLMVLVGCGASAGISAIFKAPIAGLVFTLEILMVDLTMASLLPILISSVTATVFSYIFTGQKPLFSFVLSSAWGVQRIPACILLGVCCGLISLYFIRSLGFCEKVFAKLSDRPLAKLILGGVSLSGLIFFFPSLYGEGYSAVNVLLSGHSMADWGQVMNGSVFAGHQSLLLLYVALVTFSKTFATSATTGSGGCGGTFAPALFVGGFGGFLFSRLWNLEQFGVYIPENNYTLLGMAGVMTGVMHAPLTGIFLIAELTRGYDLFMPLMIVCISSYLTTNIFETNSIYALRLAREGKLLTHHTDHSALTLMNMDELIEKDYHPVSPDLSMGELVQEISRSNNNFIPVLDDGDKLLGVIDITRIRHIIFRTELYNKFTVRQLMIQPSARLLYNESMREVMREFDATDAAQLPVIDVNNRLMGYISRTKMLADYRQVIADMSSE